MRRSVRLEQEDIEHCIQVALEQCDEMMRPGSGKWLLLKNGEHDGIAFVCDVIKIIVAEPIVPLQIGDKKV